MSSVKVKSWAPLGTVSLTIVIEPRWVLVKVQVSDSPASSWIEAWRLGTDSVELASSQLSAVRS